MQPVVDVENSPADDSPGSSDLMLEIDDRSDHYLDVTDSSSALIREDGKSQQIARTTFQIGYDSAEARNRIPNWKKYCGVAVLFFINLLNYMDRYTVAGVLIQIQEFFKIENGTTGLLQTVFIISYMLSAPLFGYLGDRYNRKLVIVAGMLLWSGFTLASSFISSPDLFPVFLLTRALVGIGEASYSTIAPTLIGDMFVGPKRTRMLSVFFFATPIGSGLGYIVGSQMASALGGWAWALRVTPALGIVAIILLMCLCPNPSRGAAEATREDKNTNTYIEDLKYLTVNKSFIYVTVGFTFMAFVLGSLSLWGPAYFTYASVASGRMPACTSTKCDNTKINFIFGVIACISGFAGVGIGAESARRWKLKGRKDADPIVCAIGLLVGSPLLLIGTHVTLESIDVAWVFVFFADLFICLTWTLIGDMTLYICEPSRRSTANAVMLLVGHLFGDAGSPYLLGIIADAVAKGMPDTYMSKYLSMQKAMYIALFACVIGGWGFLMASVYIVADKEKVDKYIKEMEGGAKNTHSNGTTESLQMSERSHPENVVSNGTIPSTSRQKDKNLSPLLLNGNGGMNGDAVVIVK